MRQPLPMTLWLALAAALLGLLFMLIGDEALEGDSRGFDLLLSQRAQAWRVSHPLLADALRDISGLGSFSVLTLFTLLTVGYLLMLARGKTALVVTVLVLAGTALVDVFKRAFGRLRPDAALADFAVAGMSFPSGHASGSAIVYFTLGALVASTRRHPGERVFVMATAALMTLVVGMSRVLLGLHWATDVLAGWAFGLGWCLLGLLLDRWWNGALEPRIEGRDDRS